MRAGSGLGSRSASSVAKGAPAVDASWRCGISGGLVPPLHCYSWVNRCRSDPKSPALLAFAKTTYRTASQIATFVYIRDFHFSFSEISDVPFSLPLCEWDVGGNRSYVWVRWDRRCWVL